MFSRRAACLRQRKPRPQFGGRTQQLATRTRLRPSEHDWFARIALLTHDQTEETVGVALLSSHVVNGREPQGLASSLLSLVEAADQDLHLGLPVIGSYRLSHLPEISVPMVRLSEVIGGGDVVTEL